MGQILHGSAGTTEAVRREIQNSEESIKCLSDRYHVNPKTIVKWRKRKGQGVSDEKTGPKKKFNTKLTAEDEAIIIAFRQKTQLPLDDCLDSLKEIIPHLSRSALHRLLQKHGLSRLPKEEEQTKEKKKFKDYPIGYVHVDITEIHFAKGEKHYLFVGICRVSKYVYAKLYDRQTVENSLDFLHCLNEAVPFKIHTILTDNGAQFTYTSQVLRCKPKTRHKFDLLCSKLGIKHKTTKPYTPQTNGQVERFNRTLKDATTKVYHYDNIKQLEKHLLLFVLAYNSAKKLSALKRMTPIQFCLLHYQKYPNHQYMGLNS